MSAEHEPTILYKKILASLVLVASVVVVANLFGEQTAGIIDSVLYGVIPAFPMILAIIYLKRAGISGAHGKAWFFFAAAVTSRFIAEQMWTVYDKFLNIDPWPSEVDLFYFLFYVLFAVFSVYYLKPFVRAIDKKKMAVAVLVSAAVFTPTVFHLTSVRSDALDGAFPELAVGIAYPVADSAVMVPAVLAILLFFEGKVSFLWSAMFVGILCLVAADTLFLIEEIESTYSIGHPLDIGYFWMYMLFGFGVYHNMRYFERQPGTQAEDLR